jgi:hypothetical protein
MAREKMKKGGVFLIVILSFLLLLSVADCLAEPYYPLKEGMVWEYQIVGMGTWTRKALAPRKLNDKKVVPLQDQNGNLSFIIEDNKGVGEYAMQNVSDIEPKISQPTEYILNYPLKKGVMAQRKDKTVFLTEKIDVDVTATIETLTDTVTVPAGTFENCLRIKYSGKKDVKVAIPFESTATVEIEGYDWFAKNVGWIKSIRTEKANNLTLGLGKQVVIQLIKFTK